MKKNSQPSSRTSAGLSRREFLATSAALSVAAAAAPEAVEARSSARKEGTISSRNSSVVSIESGQVAGYERDGVHIFKGIPYAASTAGAARFKPPRPVTPWKGVRSSRAYGPVCPQGPRAGWHNDEEAFLMRWDDGFPGEDCLRVNVWTSALGSAKKLPVMVWLHGGGFTAGSGQELPAYDGERLARTGEVVLVSVNHRLGPLGYLNLSAFDPEFAESGNVGMLDLVAALKWVKTNIASFGGDADNVTIFGQSGGGAKVTTLMAMPSARGLFHKAIVQSGSFRMSTTAEQARAIADALLEELNIPKAEFRRLQEVPADRLIAAGVAATRRIGGPRPAILGRGPLPAGWSPIVDGSVVPYDTYSKEAIVASTDIPMIIGSTRDEFGMGMRKDPALTEAVVIERINANFGGKGREIYEAFKSAYPGESPGAVYAIVASMALRESSIEQAKLRFDHAKAPAFLYWFTYVTPSLDGLPGAFHCADLPFCFDNVERCDSSTGNTREAQKLGAVMSRAWINFARTGNPSQPRLAWPQFDPAQVPTMIFDVDSRVENDPVGGPRRLLT